VRTRKQGRGGRRQQQKVTAAKFHDAP